MKSRKAASWLMLIAAVLFSGGAMQAAHHAVEHGDHGGGAVGNHHQANCSHSHEKPVEPQPDAPDDCQTCQLLASLVTCAPATTNALVVDLLLIDATEPPLVAPPCLDHLSLPFLRGPPRCV